MKECKNCKLYREDRTSCNKIVSYDGTAFLDSYSNGATYANMKEENKDGDCKYYKVSFFRKIKNMFKGN